jgi:hypothetical protein
MVASKYSSFDIELGEPFRSRRNYFRLGRTSWYFNEKGKINSVGFRVFSPTLTKLRSELSEHFGDILHEMAIGK